MRDKLLLFLEKLFFFLFFANSCASGIPLREEAKLGLRTEKELLTKTLLESKQKLLETIKETREKEKVPKDGNFFYDEERHESIKEAWVAYKEILKHFEKEKKDVLLAHLALEVEDFAPQSKNTIRYEYKKVTFYTTKILLTSGVLFSPELDASTAEVVGSYRFHETKDLNLYWFVRWDREEPWRRLEIDEKEKLVLHKPLSKDTEKGILELLNKKKRDTLSTPSSFSSQLFAVYEELYDTLYFRQGDDFLFSKEPPEIQDLPED